VEWLLFENTYLKNIIFHFSDFFDTQFYNTFT
jgi:hypothetical protein